ncbi:MAG: SDR family NAD(P)-dependent oxidoreductase [Pseudomonadales bacterium]|nr:SDR family NAD(P)-dependent oxidoreductase [Pseudomonadales bacterium]
MKNFKQKYGPWALITGASTGIGRAISEQVAQQGLNIVAVARNQNNLDALKNQLENAYGIEVKTISADLSLSESNHDIVQQTADLDIGLLIPNAGIENNGPFINNALEDEHKMLLLNTVSPMMLSHLFAQRFAKRGGGGILLTASLFAYQGVPFVSNYSASKAYILSLGEALNVELKPQGIDVTVLSPGLTDTAMTQNMAVDFNKMPITKHQPNIVALVGLQALGKKATVVPGFINKFYAWENRLIPRSWPVKLFGLLIKRAMTAENTPAKLPA